MATLLSAHRAAQAVPAPPAKQRIRLTLICATLFAAIPAAAAVPPAMYGIDNAQSWLRVLVYRGGLLRKLGHNHVVTHRNIRGCFRMETPIYHSQLAAELNVDEFVVDEAAAREAAGNDFPGSLPTDDIAATRKNMLGPALLDSNQYPQIHLTATTMTGTFPNLLMAVNVHFQERQIPVSVPITLQIQEQDVIASGAMPLAHEDLGLRPFSAALGALKVREEMQLQFNVVSHRLETDEQRSDCERALSVVNND